MRIGYARVSTPEQSCALQYDALEQRFREVKYARDPECPACGVHAMKELLPEYTEASCAVAPRRATA